MKLLKPKGYYVYELQDPTTFQTFYVGKGKAYRMYTHERKVRRRKIPNGSNYPLYHRIKDILVASGSIRYEVVNDNMADWDAYSLEDACMDYNGRTKLCNMAERWKIVNQPSVGMTGRKHTSENKLKSAYAAYKQNCPNATISMERYGEIKEDLKLLGNVIRTIRTQLKKTGKYKIKLMRRAEKRDGINKLREEKKQERYSRYRRLGILVCDRNINSYIRQCPQCNKAISYNRYDSMMVSVRRKCVCQSCKGVNESKRRGNLTSKMKSDLPIRSQFTNPISYRMSNKMSKRRMFEAVLARHKMNRIKRVVKMRKLRLTNDTNGSIT